MPIGRFFVARANIHGHIYERSWFLYTPDILNEVLFAFGQMAWKYQLKEIEVDFAIKEV